jgi:hypothetical protein
LVIIGVGSVNVFGAHANADHASGDTPEDGEVLEESKREREALEWRFCSKGGSNKTLVGENLKALGHTSGKFAALLDFFEAAVDLLAAR